MRYASSATRTCRAVLSASEYTATTRTPSARQVRAMRTAISPRLAIRIFPNRTALSAECVAAMAPTRILRVRQRWMRHRHVARGDGVHDRARRQHPHLVHGGCRPRFGIPCRRPAVQPAITRRPGAGRAVERDEHPVRQIAEPREIGDLLAARRYALAVQHGIDRVGAARPLDAEHRVAGKPGVDEAVVVAPAALGAWAVAGGERRRLVEEEQLGVAVGLHQLASAALELQQASDPAPPHPALQRQQLLVHRVKAAAAVAEQRAARRRLDDLAPRRYAILQRHATYSSSRIGRQRLEAYPAARDRCDLAAK